ITILQNAKLTTSNDRPVQKPDGSYDFDLTLSGRALAEVGVLDDKKVVFTIPEDLRGNITNPTVDISVGLLPLQLADVPLLNTTLTGLQTTLETVNGILKKVEKVPLVRRLVSGLITAITNLTTNINQTIEGLKHLGTYTDSLPGVISNDGSTITVDFDEGLGNYLQKTYAEILSPLVNGLDQFVKELVDGLPLLGKV
ncbi:adhesive domain-containing protein, partial [Bacillus cereus]|uniref:adhesive domain-containing protein n=1 Tax=Bacillus cereus TaxID=1396 RepID=UPI000C00114F